MNDRSHVMCHKGASVQYEKNAWSSVSCYSKWQEFCFQALINQSSEQNLLSIKSATN